MDERFIDTESARRWRCFAVLLLFCITCLIAGVAALIVYYEIVIKTNETTPFMKRKSLNKEKGIFEYWDNSSIFHELTLNEVTSLHTYLFTKTEFNLKTDKFFDTHNCFVYHVELLLPNKTTALQYLDYKTNNKPPREARAVIFRGDKRPPVVEEYAVGPLDDIQYHRQLVSVHHQKPVPYLFRPVSQIEHQYVRKLLKDVDKVIKFVLEDSYEASFFDCDPQCLTLDYYTPVSPSVSGMDKRLVWYWAHYNVEYFMLNPVDFFILFNFDGSNPNNYRVEKLWYAGQEFDSPEALLTEFLSGLLVKSSVPFPKAKPDSFSTINLKGTSFTGKPQRGPKIIEPDGHRYNLRQGRITYMDWDFISRMSPTTGPQLFDVKYRNKRIVYELSLQEIAMFHSGNNPWLRFSNQIHSGLLLGKKARPLIANADCPQYATFIDQVIYEEGTLKSKLVKNVFCLFELDTGYPLRRHFNFHKRHTNFYVGITDLTLILRSIITIYNYDFVIDFVFHSNGVLETKTSVSGFPLVTFHVPQEARYGFRSRENLIATIQQCSFNFKVDVDILGIKNRFQAVNIERHTVYNGDWSIQQDSMFEQLKVKSNLKMTEQEAAIQINSSSPKYLIFHNKEFKTKFKDPSGYRLHLNNGDEQLLSEGLGNEPSISWARYDVAVTKRKNTESSSSSIYATWDAKEPIVNFQSYIDDNESIVDEDLVAWVTLRSYDIPVMESLPLMQTTGNIKSFLLLPFNYFAEDPSLASRDSIRIDQNQNPFDKDKNIMRNYGLTKIFTCTAEQQHTESQNIYNNMSLFYTNKDV